jgi:cytochrome c5
MRKSVASLSILVILGAVGCSGNPSPAPDSKATQAEAKTVSLDASSAQDEKLFEGSCSKCHPTARAKDYTGTEAWNSIVRRMIDAHKAEIKPENAARVIAYLEKTYPKKP